MIKKFEFFNSNRAKDIELLKSEIKGSKKGWNRLMTLIHYGDYSKFKKELNNNNTNLEHTDDHGYTPLMLSSSLGNLKMVKDLIKRGVNIYHKDLSGKDFYDVAKYRGKIIPGVKEYIEKNFPIFIQSKKYNL